ncbi:MAG TPA: pre-peptidase C-terminal domain-containing protein [Chroococcidiopsis sp.]
MQRLHRALALFVTSAALATLATTVGTAASIAPAAQASLADKRQLLDRWDGRMDHPLSHQTLPKSRLRSAGEQAAMGSKQAGTAGTTGATGTSSAVVLQTEGELAPGDSVLAQDNSLYDEHPFTGRAGQQVTIDLQSDAFNTYLLLLGPDGDVVGQNDDGGQNTTNSQLQVTLPSNGVYTIVANGYDAASQGSYSLTVTTVLGTGDIQATLRWGTTDDLDLAIMDPNGDIVSFANTPVASGGELDVDANALCEGVTTTPVENIYWPRSRAPQGEYRLAVSLYGRCSDRSQEPIPFTLTLQVQGSTEVLRGTVDEANDVVTFSTAVY